MSTPGITLLAAQNKEANPALPLPLPTCPPLCQGVPFSESHILSGILGATERCHRAQALVPKQFCALCSRASDSGCPARTPAAFPCQFCEFCHTNLS